MLRLFYNPGSCSLSCHVALAESGLPYEAQAVLIRKGEQQSAAYLALNPRGLVPALQVSEGEVLTEAVAILQYVADQAPERALLPPLGTLERARAQEWLSFLSSTVHIAFRHLFKPERLAVGEVALHGVRLRGQELIASAFTHMEKRLHGRPYALGEQLSVVDAYLLVFHQWSKRESAAPFIPPIPSYDAIMTRVKARPAVQRVLEREARDAA
jgi:glutathione S-transferase